MTEWKWTDWIAHNDQGRPAGLEPDEIVIADLSGDILSPMPANDIDWHCPGDPVTRYKRREYFDKPTVEIFRALEEV